MFVLPRPLLMNLEFSEETVFRVLFLEYES